MTTPPRPDSGPPVLRYALDDFEQYLPPWEPAERATGQPGAPGAFVLDLRANPPFDRMSVALENDARFAATWKRRRKDLKDQSASGYAMALAAAAVSYEWTDQEIVDLLVAFYRDRVGNLDKGRLSYELTLRTARRGKAREEATSQAAVKIADMAAQVQGRGADAPDQEASAPATVNGRAAALEALSERFGLRIEALEQTDSKEPTYLIRTELGAIELGGIASIMRQDAFRHRIAAATRRVIPKLRKNETWDDVAQLLLDAAEIVDIGDEAKAVVGAQAAVAAYLVDRAPGTPIAEGEETPQLEAPFVRRTETGGQEAVIAGPDFRQWAKVRDGEMMTKRQVGMLLREAGCVPATIRLGTRVFKAWISKFPVV